MGWKKQKGEKSRSGGSFSRERTLLVLAKLVKTGRLRPSTEGAIREVVSLLCHAERDRDEAQKKYTDLVQEIRNNHDVKYLKYVKQETEDPVS